MLKSRSFFVCLFLAMAILAVFWQVRNHDFLHYDDNRYVTENSHVRAGLTKEGIVWAFTTTHVSNWHPLTWLSHMLDCQMYGLDPGAHHLNNLLFHIVNTLLLFALLKRMTGALWQSAFVAALFALHPLHVESVAWVAERKDVLSTLFWMLTMGSYVRYVEHPGATRYLVALLFFVLGLMSKPMLVTLPFVLLLMDYWPLGRFQASYGGPQAYKNPRLLYLVGEKVPFFLVAAASCVVTFLAQQSGGSLASTPLDMRMSNALLSYVSYAGKMIWPHHLAVFYPHPGMIPLWQTLGAGLILLSISVLVLRAVRRHPYLATGWLWYLGTLVPVIGLVQVGAQARADRYTYVQLIGLFIMISWGGAALLARWRHKETGLAITATILISMLTVTTWCQLRYWQNDITLFQHALDVTEDNGVAHTYLGNALLKQGRTDEAVRHYYQAVRIKPNYVEAHNNLGNALSKQGRTDEAIRHYYKVLQIDPDYEKAHSNLGNALSKRGRTDEAIRHYNEALRIKPDDAVAHYNLGNTLLEQNNTDDAIKHFDEALRIKPDDALVHRGAGMAFEKQNRIDEAIRHYSEALRINPNDATAHYNLGNVLSKQGRVDEAIRLYCEAIRIHPDYEKAHSNLGIALMQQNRKDEAMRHFREALRINPEDAEVNSNLGVALALAGKVDEAIGHFQKALEIDPNYEMARMNLKRLSSKALE